MRPAQLIGSILLTLALAACGGRATALKSAGTVARQSGTITLASQRAPAPVGSVGDVPALATVNALQGILTQLYASTNPSVVTIEVPGVGSGSGFVYDTEGHIVTNNHVAEMGSRYELRFADGSRVAASRVGGDAGSDLAVLKAESLPDGATPLRLATGDPAVGEFAVAIGTPFGEEGSMTLGIVSGLGRTLPSRARLSSAGSSYSLPGLIQTDAPINPGNSGGPLLNLDGEIIGVNVAIASTSGSGAGVGFAIPAAAVQRVVPALIAEGRYAYSYLGAAFDGDLTLADEQQYGLSQPGAYIVALTPGSPAAAAGLRAADPTTGRGGDLVIAVDGQPVRDFATLNHYLIFHTSPQQQITLTVVRDGQAQEITVTLAARPS